MRILNQLNYFISVAEFQSFTKAATHHFITQTAISQQIMAMEQELGFKLFYRNNRSVELTEAGLTFLKEAKMIITKFNAAVEDAKKVDAGVKGILRVAFTGIYEQSFLPSFIREFNRNYPDINLILSQGHTDNLRTSLVEGNLDLAFNAAFGAESVSDLCWKTIIRNPIYAILYRNHRLANEPFIDRSTLADEAFILIDRKEASYAYDAIIQDCLRAGFYPKIKVLVHSIETAILMVEAEIGITIFPMHQSFFKNDQLRFIKLNGEYDYVDVNLEWIKNNPNPALPQFIDFLDTYRNNSPLTPLT